jgi:hypothetical protein
MFTVNQSAKVARCGRKASLTPSGALTVPVQPGGPFWFFGDFMCFNVFLSQNKGNPFLPSFLPSFLLLCAYCADTKRIPRGYRADTARDLYGMVVAA